MFVLLFWLLTELPSHASISSISFSFVDYVGVVMNRRDETENEPKFPKLQKQKIIHKRSKQKRESGRQFLKNIHNTNQK